MHPNTLALILYGGVYAHNTCRATKFNVKVCITKTLTGILEVQKAVSYSNSIPLCLSLLCGVGHKAKCFLQKWIGQSKIVC